MIRRPPRSTQSGSSAASDVYRRQVPWVYVNRYMYIWAYGMKSTVSKPGKPSNLDNYRGIIILTIMSKIFEFIVNNRLCFVNDAFDRTDTFNGRFLKGVV